MPDAKSEGRSAALSTKPEGWRRARRKLVAYAASIVLVAIATGISHISVDLASSASLTLIFLIAVVVSANRFGLWPAVLTSLLSVLCWDYFFTVPYYSLELDDPRDIFALIAFLTVSLIVSGMTAQIRQQNSRLAALAQSITESYGLSQTLSQLATLDELAGFATSHLSRVFGGRAVILLEDHNAGASRLIFPKGEKLEPEDLAAADAALHPLAVHPGAGSSAQSRYRFLPFDGSRGRIGSIGMAGRDPSTFTVEERQQFDGFVTQAAIAIERAWLTRDIEHARMTAETERIRNALLISVSHDLRTPLTTIIGALTTLKTMGTAFSPAIHAELLANARGEAERLNRFVGNLLDITKLESGGLTARLTAVDIGDAVDSALERAQPLLSGHRLHVELPPDSTEVHADFALLDQVLFNVLDNAAKYSPSGSTITVRAAASEDSVIITISDEGRGIPQHAFEKIFEKFARFDHADSVSPGTGLGLMICRGFLSVMGGTITAANRPDRQGAVFSIRLVRWSAA